MEMVRGIMAMPVGAMMAAGRSAHRIGEEALSLCLLRLVRVILPKQSKLPEKSGSNVLIVDGVKPGCAWTRSRLWKTVHIG